MNPELYHEAITSLNKKTTKKKHVKRLKSKDKFCETTVAWKLITSCECAQEGKLSTAVM